MKCPKCGGETKVFDSRDVHYGRWRRHECLCCKHRFSTVEIGMDEFKSVSDQLEFMKIVKCRECKYRRKAIFTNYCSHSFGLKQITDLDGFCSNGEGR
jgi:hypothetical protein